MAHAIGFPSIQSSTRRMSAAALSAAVDSTKFIEEHSTLRRNHLCRNAPAKRQPLFGREGSGGRGASLREAATPPRISPP